MKNLNLVEQMQLEKNEMKIQIEESIFMLEVMMKMVIQK
jgi:hypothetical protein